MSYRGKEIIYCSTKNTLSYRTRVHRWRAVRWRKKTKFCLPQSLRAQPPYGRTQAQVAPCSRSKLSGALWWRSGKKKESLQLRLWNLNVCVEKVDTKCWLVEVTLVMMSLPWHVFFNVCLHLRSFPLCADWRKSNSSVDGEPHGNWRWNSSSRDVVASSPSFFPSRRQSAPESLLAGYPW